MRVLLINVLLFSVQAAVVIACGGLALSVARASSPRLRFIALRGLLALVLALPVLTPRTVDTPRATVATSLARVALGDDIPSVGAVGVTDSRLGHLALGGWLLGMLVRIAAIALGVWRLRRWARDGTPVTGDDDLRAALGPSADVRYVERVHHPVTFGWGHPTILLPPRLAAQSDHVRRAVLCHELLHVRRRDWAWLVVEESVRAALWFHPAVWWLISRVQLTREELVDRLVIGRLGNRRAYVEALLTFEDSTPFRPATAFGTRHHLVQRIRGIAKEVHMSPVRVVIACALFVLAVGIGGWQVVDALPLQSWGPAGAGPLERQARPITPENPIPRRTASALPRFPEALLSAKLDLVMTVNVTIDAGGRVVEHRPVSTQYGSISVGPDARQTMSSDAAAQLQGALDGAFAQWLYDPPFESPMTFPVSFRFIPMAPAGTVVELTTPLSDSAVPTWHGGALRAGDGIPPPKKIKDVRPEYPEDARAANIAGIVILEIRIEADGRVSHARVLRSIPALDQAALDAVTQWEFQPALKDGTPTAIVMMVTVNFTRK